MSSPECKFDKRETIVLRLYSTDPSNHAQHAATPTSNTPNGLQIVLDDHCGIAPMDEQVDAIAQRQCPSPPFRTSICRKFFPGYRRIQVPQKSSHYIYDALLTTSHESHMGWIAVASRLGSHIKQVVLLVDMNTLPGLSDTPDRQYVKGADDFIQWREIMEVIRILRHGTRHLSWERTEQPLFRVVLSARST